MPRIAVIEKDKCSPHKCGDYLCTRLCPLNRMGEECIIKNKKPVIDEELCNGCGICSNRCPFKAISIINLPEELKATPVHQYGQNGFRLYKLPIPKFGKVVGILGKNGIGKTTAIKILAEVLQPNLGNLEQPTSWDEVIQFFKGTETQNYFEKIKDKKIKIAFKPQRVDLIPETTKGKVKDILKKVDEKNQLEKIAKELEIDKILNNDIKNISGGELQRVAIAATLLKKANLYIFDEPTSYLDIKQRLKVAKIIRNLANEKTAVLIVEHDLIVLDYMTDLVHLMYGKESCYGVVSQPKTTKAGINIYLEGYLKEENVRFRDKQIKFLVRPPIKTKKGTPLTSWPATKKKLNSFNLEADEGSINKEEVIGILGPNAIGKTSFVKILAGILKPDTNKIDLKLKVAYKPQYIEAKSDVLVKAALSKAKKEILQPLDLQPLLTKKLSELSGGELQRVAIANTLSQDADLFLLDEPSAYLDVEQRLAASKVINEVMKLKNKSALVVDHDLLFLDYLSDRLLVFEGQPAVNGIAKGPFDMRLGMNLFLKELKISMRRDTESHRPRVNKLDSQMDVQQKKKGELYYT